MVHLIWSCMMVGLTICGGAAISLIVASLVQVIRGEDWEPLWLKGIYFLGAAWVFDIAAWGCIFAMKG